MNFILFYLLSLLKFGCSFKHIIPNKYLHNNKNIINDNFLYIITHIYECDDYFYQNYCDVYRIYKNKIEALQQIYNINNNEELKEYHFKIIKYRINTINEMNKYTEIIYDSNKHIITEKLEINVKDIEKEEDFIQARRLYNWADV